MEPEPANPDVVTRLAAYARRVGGRRAGPPVVLAHRTGELVLRCGEIVVKRHSASTDRAALSARLAVVAGPLTDVLLSPLAHDELDGRSVTAWPAGRPVLPHEVLEAPWEAAAELLARLHAAAAPVDLGAAGGPGRVVLAMRRLVDSDVGAGVRARVVREAYRRLPAWTRAAAPPPRLTLSHGDWHLGQLVRLPGRGWRLIDLDDLGTGDPAWDLARPAAWFAAGLLPPDAWRRFLTAYTRAGGIALPPDVDPWVALEPSARALTVQLAALSLVNHDLDVAEAFVSCCRRMLDLVPPPEVRRLSKLAAHLSLSREGR